MKDLPAPGPRLASATSIFLVAIWGTTWGAILFSLEGFPPLLGLGLRFALGSALLWIWLWRWGAWQRPSARLWGLWASQASLAFGVAYGLVYWAEQWVPSGLTAVLFSTFPLWVTLFGYFLLPAERLNTFGLFGIVLGFVGVGVIYSDDLSALGGAEVAFAASVVMLAPISAGINQVVMKRWGAGFHSLILTAPPMSMAAAIILVLSWILERHLPVTPTVASVTAVVYLGIVGSAITFALYYWLLQHTTAIKLSLIAFATPVVAVAIGTLALDEPLTLRIALGASLVLTGVGCVVLPGRRRAGDAE